MKSLIFKITLRSKFPRFQLTPVNSSSNTCTHRLPITAQKSITFTAEAKKMQQARQNLPKEERLRSKKIWSDLMTRGQKSFRYPIQATFYTLADTEMLQVAFIAPKRRYKKAVDRNRQKRMLREAYRLSPFRPAADCPLAMAFMSVADVDSPLHLYQKSMDKILAEINQSLMSQK